MQALSLSPHTVAVPARRAASARNFFARRSPWRG